MNNCYITLVVKRKLWAILRRVLLEKYQHREAGKVVYLLLKNYMTQDFQRHFNLNTCLREWIIFLLLIVSVSLVILIALPVVFSLREHRLQEYSKCGGHQTLLKITHNEAIKKENKNNKFFIMFVKHWQLALQIWHLSKVRTGWLYRWFWIFFLTFSLKAHYFPAYRIGRDWSDWIVPTLWNSLHKNVL